MISAIAGAIRGVTGFGGALVMTPPLALLFGPWLAVPVALLLESLVAMPMVMQESLSGWVRSSQTRHGYVSGSTSGF